MLHWVEQCLVQYHNYLLHPCSFFFFGLFVCLFFFGLQQQLAPDIVQDISDFFDVVDKEGRKDMKEKFHRLCASAQGGSPSPSPADLPKPKVLRNHTIRN